MPEYLVEVYAERLDAGQLAKVTRRARTTAAGLMEPGGPVHYLGAIAVPGDELCFHLYAGPTADAVCEAARQAGIAAERIVEAVHLCFESDLTGSDVKR